MEDYERFSLAFVFSGCSLVAIVVISSVLQLCTRRLRSSQKPGLYRDEDGTADTALWQLYSSRPQTYVGLLATVTLFALSLASSIIRNADQAHLSKAGTWSMSIPSVRGFSLKHEQDTF